MALIFRNFSFEIGLPLHHSSVEPRANARDSDATVWFGDAGSPGGRTTLPAGAGLGRPVYLLIEGLTRPSDVAAWIEANRIGVLNVAGNRESVNPGIGERAGRFLLEVLRRLAR